MIKLLSIVKSHKPEKKYDAIFEHDGRRKVIPFGASGMSDYTKHHDVERKERYLSRHKTTENWNNPMSAGALSRWILWSEPTMKKSIEKFKKKFDI